MPKPKSKPKSQTKAKATKMPMMDQMGGMMDMMTKMPKGMPPKGMPPKGMGPGMKPVKPAKGKTKTKAKKGGK